MRIEALFKNMAKTNEKMVAVSLPVDVINKMQTIRKETGKTNGEVYTAFLRDGLDKYATLKAKDVAKVQARVKAKTTRKPKVAKKVGKK